MYIYLDTKSYGRDRAFRSADGKTYGGVCFYVRSSVNFVQRKDMSIDDLENLCIQIQKPNSKPFLVATWYRPPNRMLINLIILRHLLTCLMLKMSSTIYWVT